MTIQTRIIDLIRRNRISTTEVADCMNKSGLVPGARAVNLGKHKVGPVFWAYSYNESNWAIHDQLRAFPEGAVLVAEPIDCNSRAIFGSLVAKFLMLYRQACAIVVMGPLRDMPHLIKEQWPVWCAGATPIGCFNVEENAYLPKERLRELREPYEGAIAVCDDSGVVVVPAALQNEAFLDKLHWIEEQEDIWFDCIDRRKWDTFDTVCLKKYREL
jgi:4-hydroxy-4-methyl-2-oxoglutarate aldolase